LGASSSLFKEIRVSDAIETYTDQNWEKEVVASDRPVLVDFWAEWCKPCLAMVPDLEAVAEAYKGRLRVGKVNVEENNDVAFKYNVTGMPTVIVLKGGKVLEQRVGKLSKDALVKLVEPHLS
jgi:thioredoxin 1